MTCEFDQQEFRAFMKWLMRNFFRKCRINGVRDTYQAACCIGRQPHSEIWVFGESLQINGEGDVIDEERSSVVWVTSIIDSDEGTRRRERSSNYLPTIRLPLNSLALRDVVTSLNSTLHNNGIAGVFTIAGMLLGLHYESIIDVLGFCPLPIVCGVNRLGKTKSAKGALCLIGNQGNFFSAVRDRFIPRLCSRSTLPPVLDDIKSPKVIEDVAVSFYNCGKDGTCLLETAPRTCPIVTVNWETLDGLNRDPRVFGRLVLVPFLEGRRSPNGVEAQQISETEAEGIFASASSAIGMMISVSTAVPHICTTRCRELSKAVSQKWPELDDRCVKNYALLISFAEKVLQLADVEGMEPRLALSFFKEVIYPFAIKDYQIEYSVASPHPPESGESLIVDLLVKCITMYKIPREQMLTCVNPDITFKLNFVRHRGVAVALKWLFATIRNFGGTPPPEDKIRQEIRALDIGLVGDKKQYFNKYPNGKKISRAAGGVEIQSKCCVAVKYSAFLAESWEVFSEAFEIKGPAKEMQSTQSAGAQPDQSADNRSAAVQPEQLAGQPSAGQQSAAVQLEQLAGQPSAGQRSPSAQPDRSADNQSAAVQPEQLAGQPSAGQRSPSAQPDRSAGNQSAAVQPEQLAGQPSAGQQSPSAQPDRSAVIRPEQLAGQPAQLAGQPSAGAQPEQLDLDDSGINLEVESESIEDIDVQQTLQQGKRRLSGIGKTRPSKRIKKSQVSKSYKYCICKEEHSAEEEDSMIICENNSRKKNLKCPGNQYYHLKCLKLHSVPKANPWYCSTCKAILNQDK